MIKNSYSLQDSNVEYLVVGTGPTGATIARELAIAKKNVLIIEKGKWHSEHTLGFPLGIRILDGFGYLSKSIDGTYIGRAITVGGCSMVYNANVFNPTNHIMQALGMDLMPEVTAIRKEIGVSVLPERFFHHCEGGNRLREAAYKMGLTFIPQEKFINPDKCKIGCDWCMLGCKYQAKWTSRAYLKEALQNNATLIHSIGVKKVLFHKQRAIGVLLENNQKLYAQNIIVSAGGMGSAQILLRSGINYAGLSLFIDPMNLVIGYGKDASYGGWKEMTFTHAIESFKETHGFIISNISASYAAIATSLRNQVFLNHLKDLPYIKRGIGLFVKLADTPYGWIRSNGKTCKPLTMIDQHHMKVGTELAKDILQKAGISSKNITVVEMIGGHPGGTAAIGKVVDKSFKTEYDGLYVCDTSIFPESPGIPPTLTLLALAMRFSQRLLGNGR
ncbi:MAG: GMC family oxidoreductase [Desulfobacterales bacterium]|nr:GMC family oxidoreductase [Desulfobacterales bacterium]